jgi:hypothetical protein
MAAQVCWPCRQVQTRRGRRLNADAWKRRDILIAAIRDRAVGDAKSAADRVRSQGYRVRRSDVDLLSDLDRIVDLDAEIAHGAFDFGMSEQKLDGSQIPSSPVNQHRLRATQ